MTELHYQYDLLSPGDALAGYSILLVTDGLFDKDFVAAAQTFMQEGGWLVASGLGLIPVDDEVRAAWHTLLGLVEATPSAFPGEFYSVTTPGIQSDDLPAMPHYVHAPAVDVTFDSAVTPLADGWRSPAIRARESFYGHFHGPATDATGPSIGMMRCGQGGAILVAPQLFSAYLHTGYHAHRKLVRNLLDNAIPAEQRVLRTNAPTLVELTVGDKDGKLILQALPFIAERRDRNSFESLCEHPPVFRDIWVELPKAADRTRALNPITQCDMPMERTDTGILLRLPEFNEHLLVVIE